MTLRLEYHKAVQRSIPAPLALFGMLVLPLLLFLSSSSAQINGAPASVTSPGFGGRTINGTPPSVTSLGRNGFAPANSGVNFHNQFPHNGGHHHHHIVSGSAYYPYVYAVPVPSGVDVNGSDAADGDDDSYYQGGPTIFDRRGSGRDSYIPPSYPGPAHAHSAASTESMPNDPPASDSGAERTLEPPQPSTVLVFKDSHQLEVGNYAIVSQTLYDLTSGHPRKIALADLDLPATQKQNDDRGVPFQLPPSAQAN
jgi:hypothetical protein